MKFHFRNGFYFFLFFSLVGCGGCGDPADPNKEKEVETALQPLQSIRLDSLLFYGIPSDPHSQRQFWSTHPETGFCEWLEMVVRIGDCQDSTTYTKLQQFIQFKGIRDIQAAVKEVHTAVLLKGYNLEFQQAFERMRLFLPKEKNPTVVYMNSGWNFNSYDRSPWLFIGLDWYLNAHPILKTVPTQMIPKYMQQDMQTKYLVTNGVFNHIHAIASRYDTIAPPKKDLMHEFIRQGKRMYLLDICMPETPDSIKFMWTAKQWEWAEENELKIWKEAAKQEVMFGTKSDDILKWFDFAPYTNVGAIPMESPPQLGIWLGWKMVKAYMAKNPKLSVEQLLAEPRAEAILAAYKPKLP